MQRVNISCFGLNVQVLWETKSGEQNMLRLNTDVAYITALDLSIEVWNSTFDAY